MNNKVGLYLSGGGAKGSFEIGVIKALEEKNIKPDVICGSSIGALIGGAATYLTADEMLNCYKKLTMESVLNVDSKPLNNLIGKKKNRKIIISTLKSCLLNGRNSYDNIKNLLYSTLSAKEIMQSDTDFGLSTITTFPHFKYSIVDKQNMTEDDVLKYILASMRLPIFTSIPLAEGKKYFDCASLKPYPLSFLKKRDCKKVILVDLMDKPEAKMNKDIENTGFDRNTKIIRINMPNVSSKLDFTEKQTMDNFQSGYETGEKILRKCI